jgi:hypothetical protein
LIDVDSPCPERDAALVTAAAIQGSTALLAPPIGRCRCRAWWAPGVSTYLAFLVLRSIRKSGGV